MHFWRKRDGRDIDLEARLRTSRPKARSEFTAALVARIEGGERRFTKHSIALAFALTLVILASLAAFGGIGYASNGGKSTFKAIKATFTAAPSKKAQKLVGGPDPRAAGADRADRKSKPKPRTNCSTGQRPANKQYCTNTHSRSKGH